MTDERYKKIMADLGMPNSQSLLLALQQVANEVRQACEAQHEKELTALQARVRGLEKCLSDAVQFDGQDVRGLDIIETAEKLLSNTTPDQALQRALLDTRIDELGHNFISDSKSMRAREKELRANRAELGE